MYKYSPKFNQKHYIVIVENYKNLTINFQVTKIKVKYQVKLKHQFKIFINLIDDYSILFS